jgi:hypothetical protein
MVGVPGIPELLGEIQIGESQSGLAQAKVDPFSKTANVKRVGRMD